VTIGDQVYDRVVLPGASNGGTTAGVPRLPARGASILLPYGAEVASVEISGERVLIGRGYTIEPTRRSCP